MRGVSVLERTWLAKQPSRDIAVYMVWSDQRGARERHVPGAARLMADPRVRHFWDGEEVVGKAFQPVLDASAPVWDVWMLFDRTAVWAGPAPVPSWLEQQGGLNDGPQLDGPRFARRADRLLSR